MGKVNSVLDKNKKKQNTRLTIVTNMLKLNRYHVLLLLRNNAPFSNTNGIVYCRAKVFSKVILLGTKTDTDIEMVIPYS